MRKSGENSAGMFASMFAGMFMGFTVVDQACAKLSIAKMFDFAVTDLGENARTGDHVFVRTGLIWQGALYLCCETRAPLADIPSQTAWFRLTPQGGRERLALDPVQLQMLAISSLAPTPRGWILIPRDSAYRPTDPAHTTADPVPVHFLPIENHSFGALRRIATDRDLPIYRPAPKDEAFVRLFTQESGHVLFGAPLPDGYVVAVPFTTGAHFRSVAFLKLDHKFRTARWQDWPDAAPLSKAGQIKRLFGLAAPPMQFGDFVTLHHSDFPEYPAFAENPIRPLQVATDGKGLFTFSRGATDSVKYGAASATLAEIAADGRITRHIHAEDHRSMSQKCARRGVFVDGGRSFAIHSVFQSTDPWHGAWACIALADGRVTVLAPPRGCKGMSVLDIDGDSGWFQRGEKDGRLTVWYMTWDTPPASAA